MHFPQASPVLATNYIIIVLTLLYSWPRSWPVRVYVHPDEIPCRTPIKSANPYSHTSHSPQLLTHSLRGKRGSWIHETLDQLITKYCKLTNRRATNEPTDRNQSICLIHLQKSNGIDWLHDEIKFQPISLSVIAKLNPAVQGHGSL